MMKKAHSCVTAAAILSVGCALAGAGTWKVPNWCPIVTAEGAVKEWIGKTWSGHVQGMCVSSNAIYFSYHDQIVKTDWYGRFLKRVEVPVHGGTYIYSSYYTKDETAHTPNLIVYDKNFKVVAKYVYGWNHGMDVLPGGKDGAVRFAFCYTPNWMHARQQPSLPVQGVVTFAELKDGKFSDLTRYGSFDKQIER